MDEPGAGGTIKGLPKWVWWVGGGIVVLALLLARRSSGSSGTTVTQVSDPNAGANAVSIAQSDATTQQSAIEARTTTLQSLLSGVFGLSAIRSTNDAAVASNRIAGDVAIRTSSIAADVAEREAYYAAHAAERATDAARAINGENTRAAVSINSTIVGGQTTLAEIQASLSRYLGNLNYQTARERNQTDAARDLLVADATKRAEDNRHHATDVGAWTDVFGSIGNFVGGLL